MGGEAKEEGKREKREADKSSHSMKSKRIDGRTFSEPTNLNPNPLFTIYLPTYSTVHVIVDTLYVS